MRTDFEAKYVKRCGSTQGSAFWGLRNQYVTFRPPNFPQNSHFGRWWQGWPCDPPCMTTVQGQNVKGQGHVMYQQQERYNLAVDGHTNFKLGGNYYPGSRRR